MPAPTALVTGGAGFIGSTLVRLLIDRGYRVRIYDDLSSGTREHLDGLDVDLVLGDVRELEPLTRACDGCKTMFHLAAGAGVVDSIEDPIGNFDLNARGTLVALWAAKQAGVERFVFSSSNAPLGDNAYPAREDKPVAPLSPYGAGKATGEAYCSAFHGAYGFDAVAVRFSNAYGPRSARKSNVIPLFIRRILAGEPLTIYGDGSQTRSFCYVDDEVRGFLALLDGPITGPCNIGNPGEFTMLELAGLVQEITGSSSELVYEPLPVDDPTQRKPDITQAREHLGWEPTIELREGLERTAAYFRTKLGL
jgi:nucleoside-diphosphate-sugar epimerase